MREALSAIVAREWILQAGLGGAGVVVEEVRLGAVGLVDMVVGSWSLTVPFRGLSALLFVLSFVLVGSK